MTTIPTKKYYVYSLADIGGTPFYVGKGTKGRLFSHEKEAFSGCGCDKCIAIRSVWESGGEIKKNIHFQTDDEVEAYAYETRLINEYGFENLRNKQPGGDHTRYELDKIQAPRRGHGDGSVYQRRDGRWCAEVHIGTVNGKRKHKTFYAKTYDDADHKAKIWKATTLATPPSDDRVKLGTIMDDGRKIGSVIRASDVIAMRAAHAAGESYTSIGKRYSISNVAARNAIKGRTWKDVVT